MKTLLIKLTHGLHALDIKDDEKAKVEEFLSKGYLNKQDGIYKLNSKYRFGTIGVVQSSSAYLSILALELKDLFIEDLSGASEGDLVLVQRLIGKRGIPSAKIVEILGKAQSYGVSYVALRDGLKVLIDLKTELPSGVMIENIDNYKVGDLFKIDKTTMQSIAFLGNMQDPRVDEAIVLAWFNKHSEFEDDVLDIAKNFIEVDIKNYPNYKDLRDLDFCTIDPVSAKDFDDAIFYDEQNSTLFVAIADVSEYVKPFGPLDNEASYRSFSIYFPHKSIPMLPRALSETLCSLQPNVDRLAYVFELKLDPSSLEVVESKLYEAIINSKRRFNYDEVDNIFEQKLDPANATEERLFSRLLKLKQVTDRLRKKRLKSGYDFDSKEIELTLDENTNIISTTYSKSTPSHSLIEDCMLLANKAAASRFTRGIFRVHEAPTQSKLQNLYEDLAQIGIFVDIKDTLKETIEALQEHAQEIGLKSEVDTLIIRSQMQAKYSPINLGHFGLGFDEYTHFTSPIRRYSDLIVHRLLKALAAKDTMESSYVLRNIESLSVIISQKEREAMMVEEEYKARKFARWAKENIDKTFKARVVEMDNELKAELHDVISGARVHLITTKKVSLFEDIFLKITKVDIYKAKIYASLVGNVDV